MLGLGCAMATLEVPTMHATADNSDAKIFENIMEVVFMAFLLCI